MNNCPLALAMVMNTMLVLLFCGACLGSSMVSMVLEGGLACDDFVERMPCLR